MSKPLSIRHDGSVVWLTLNRPERGNALDAELVEEMIAAVDHAYEEDVHLMALSGAGANFCTGFDLSNMETERDGDLVLRFIRVETLLQRLYGAPFVTIALAAGRTWGAGADLFAACDHRLTTPGASFAFPGAAFGVLLGTRRLIDRIGANSAREIIRSGRRLDASEALACGLATAKIATEQFPYTVKACAEDSGRLDHGTLAALHRVSRRPAQAEDMAELVLSASHPGLKERIQAYRERLRPRPSDNNLQ